MKRYVPIFFDWSEQTEDLSQEQKGNLIDAVVDYASERKTLDEIIYFLSPIERVAFRFLKGQIDRNDEISAIRSKAGSNKQEQKPAKDIKAEQNETKEIKEKQTVKRFAPPTVEEVRAYCKERRNSVDAEQFVAFYASKGWKVGDQPMKNWRQAIITWERRDKQNTEKPAKVVIAQQYKQRDISGADQEVLERMKKMVMEGGA